MIKSYKELEIYQEGYELLKEIYEITSKYPKEEQYVMLTQIRRAALSIVLNIAEGYGRQSKDDFKRFLKMSFGSVNEVEVLLELSKDLKYISEEQYNGIIGKYNTLGKRIYTLMIKWQKKKREKSGGDKSAL